MSHQEADDAYSHTDNGDLDFAEPLPEHVDRALAQGDPLVVSLQSIHRMVQSALETGDIEGLWKNKLPQGAGEGTLQDEEHLRNVLNTLESQADVRKNSVAQGLARAIRQQLYLLQNEKIAAPTHKTVEI